MVQYLSSLSGIPMHNDRKQSNFSIFHPITYRIWILLNVTQHNIMSVLDEAWADADIFCYCFWDLSNFFLSWHLDLYQVENSFLISKLTLLYLIQTLHAWSWGWCDKVSPLNTEHYLMQEGHPALTSDIPNLLTSWLCISEEEVLRKGQINLCQNSWLEGGWQHSLRTHLLCFDMYQMGTLG